MEIELSQQHFKAGIISQSGQDWIGQGRQDKYVVMIVTRFEQLKPLLLLPHHDAGYG
jgi:hypothetical protein